MIKVRSLFIPPDFPDDQYRALYDALCAAPDNRAAYQNAVLAQCIIVTAIDLQLAYDVAAEARRPVIEVD